MGEVTEGGIRGEVCRRWVNAGKPKWDFDQTMQEVLAVDRAFAAGGQMPAPRLRKERLNENRAYIGQWVHGCKFPWLEPYLSIWA